MALRVVVWGTGNMGVHSLRTVLADPGLELAGVIVHSESKVGRDAGELCGRPSTGIRATRDPAKALGTRPDACAYMASGDMRPSDTLDDLEQCLRAGVNVVTPSVYAFYDPPSAPPPLLERIDAACRGGNASLFATGIDPGWANNLLPVLLSGLCDRIQTIRCQEIFDYGFYHAPGAVRDLIGFGRPLDEVPPMLTPGVPTMIWGGSVRAIARALDVPLDDVREVIERRPLTRTVTRPVVGTFEVGRQGAFRFEVQGLVRGEPRIIVEHVTRIDPELALDWPVPAGAGEHRIVIEGSNRFEVVIRPTDEHGNAAEGGNATAAARLVRAIPAVVAARRGLVDPMAIPFAPGRGLLV